MTAGKKRKDKSDDHLPADGWASVLSDEGHILWRVLQCLPLKALFRCKCVCRTWNSVISDPYFRRQYVSSSYEEIDSLAYTLVMRYHCKHPCSVPYFIDGIGYIEMGNRCFPIPIDQIASSCGLLLLVNWNLLRYFVYNPLTGATKELPPSQRRDHHCLAAFICREPEAEDDCSSRYYFEVVLVPALTNTNGLEIETYSSSTRLWSSWPVPRGFWPVDIDHGVVVSRGKVYWTSNEHVVGVFDPATKQVDALPLPRQRRCACPCLGEDASGALLCGVYDNKGLDVLLLRPHDRPGSGNWAAAAQQNYAADQLWLTVERVEFLEIAEKQPRAAEHLFPIPNLSLYNLNNRKMKFIFIRPNHITPLFAPGIEYDIRNRKWNHVASRSFRCIRYREPSWPFCL